MGAEFSSAAPFLWPASVPCAVSASQTILPTAHGMKPAPVPALSDEEAADLAAVLYERERMSRYALQQALPLPAGRDRPHGLHRPPRPLEPSAAAAAAAVVLSRSLSLCSRRRH